MRRDVWAQVDIGGMRAIFEIDDAEQMAGIWVTAMDSVAENRNVGGPSLGHHKQLVDGALKALECLFNFISFRIEKKYLGAHLVDADHPCDVFHA